MPRKGYFYDLSVLDKWSEMGAWLLGFSFADLGREREQEYCGSKSHLKNRVYNSSLNSWHLGQEEQNLYILKRIKDHFKTNAEIEHKKDGSYSLNLFSKEISEYFDGYISFDKMEHEYPKDLPEKHDAHFMRGYLDGDGSVWICKDGSFGAYFMGGPYILSTIKEKLEDVGISSYGVRKMDVRAYRLDFNQRNAFKVCDYLYQSADIYMPSKHEKYLLSSGPLDSNIRVNTQLKSANTWNAEGKTNKYLSDIIGSRRDLAEMLKYVLGKCYVTQQRKGLEVYKYPYPKYKTKGWDLDTVKDAGNVLAKNKINYSFPKRGRGQYKSYTIYIPFLQKNVFTRCADYRKDSLKA